MTSTVTPPRSMIPTARSARPRVLETSGERFSVQLMNSALRSEKSHFDSSASFSCCSVIVAMGELLSFRSVGVGRDLDHRRPEARRRPILPHRAATREPAVAGNAVQSSEGPRRYRDRSTSTTVDGTTSRVELKQVMGLNSFKMISPTVGSSVPLLFDERSGKVKFDVDDPRIALDSSDFLREDHKEDRDAYKSALKGALL